jgi:Protein of unknown function (DUF4238)
MKNKRQHFVPQSYLKAWCDASTPAGQEPYVWLFDKSGGQARRKAPAKIFVEKDFYTIKGADGERDLVLEHGLSQLETRFVALRDRKLDMGLPLSLRDRINLAAFVAAAFARTKSRAAFKQEQWQRVLDHMQRMADWMETARPDEIEAMSGAMEPSLGEEASSLTIEDVQSIVEQPVQAFMVPEIEAVTPILARMPLGIIQTGDSPGFITSDAPCVWFDTELFKKTPRMGAGGLISPTIEISMPVSPRQSVLFGHQLASNGRYLTLQPNDPVVDHMNQRVCRFSDEHVVVNQNVFKQTWI